jgi:CRP/FNR family cyclic AMP-dependent transcriptional regulator
MADYNIKQCKTFLRLLSKEDRNDILKKSTNREFKKGEQIVRVMDRDTNLYLINTGCVRVTLYSNEGKEVSFVDIDAGGNFGEFSAIDGKPRSANVIALSDTTITVVPPSEFVRMLEKYPEVCIEILQQLTGIVRRLCDRIFGYSTLDVSDRVHTELLRLAKKNLDYDGIARVHNPPTQSELASRVSCTLARSATTSDSQPS